MASKTFKKRDGKEFTVYVDDKYYFLLKEYNWFLRNGCAATTMYSEGKEKSVYLHRIILENSIKRHENKTGKRARIIFVDKNKLNCQSKNIKIQRDSKKRKKKGTSKYRGVSFDTRNKKWRGKITVNKKVILDQLFDTEYEAWKAVDEERKKFNKNSSKKTLSREDWEDTSSTSKKKLPNKIHKNIKEKIDDKFDRYFRNSQEEEVSCASNFRRTDIAYGT